MDRGAWTCRDRGTGELRQSQRHIDKDRDSGTGTE